MVLGVLGDRYSCEGSVHRLAHPHRSAPYPVRMSCDSSSGLYLHVHACAVDDILDDSGIDSSRTYRHDGLVGNVVSETGFQISVVVGACRHLSRSKGAYVEGVSSAHADQLGQRKHGDAVERVLGERSVHGPVDMDRHLDERLDKTDFNRKTMVRKERILSDFIELASIDSPSYGEREITDVLKKKLEDLGFQVKEDDAAEKIGGSAGNLYAYLPGSIERSPILFCGHTDTVEPSRGKKPVVDKNGRISSETDTVLGGDDLCGITEILEGVRHLEEENIPHRPVEVILMAAEEVFGKGAKAYDYDGWGFRSKEAYVMDMSGDVGIAALRAPTLIGWTATVKGKAAHAGFSPEKGVNAISQAVQAVAVLSPGRLDDDTTMNIGKISGGKANNIVPDRCIVTGEVRSLDHEKAYRVIEEIRKAFLDHTDESEFEIEEHIVTYNTPEDHSVVKRFRRACERLGLPGRTTVTLGGSDNNILALHGITGIVLSCGMQRVHSTEEYTDLEELRKGAAMVAELIVDPE